MWGFFGVYIVAFGALMVLLIAIGEDQVTAFSAIAACMNNTGTGLGEVASNFATLSDPGKWICLVAMLLGPSGSLPAAGAGLADLLAPLKGTPRNRARTTRASCVSGYDFLGTPRLPHGLPDWIITLLSSV